MINFDFDAHESVKFDAATSTYRLSHDWTGTESLSNTIATAIGAITETSPDQLPPMYDTIDPDALDNLFQTDEDGIPRTAGWLCFLYDRFEVTVHVSGNVAITDTSGDRRSAGGQ